MNRSTIVLFLALISPGVSADLRVFACEPEWEALAIEIGGARITTFSATTALQDPHYIQARPSLISQVRRADLVICSGSDLEIGWLPMLLNKANNPHVRPGSSGYLEASTLVERLEIPDQVDRIRGDMHPQGNPHVQLSPNNIALIARGLADRMTALDPEGDHQARLQDFLSRWNAATQEWTRRAEPLTGKRIIVHHRSFSYLADWLSLTEVAQLEPVPGVPPTAAHLSSLLGQLGSDGKGAEFILFTPYQDEHPSQWLSQRTGIPAVRLPLTVGASPAVKTLFDLFNTILDQLLNPAS